MPAKKSSAISAPNSAPQSVTNRAQSEASADRTPPSTMKPITIDLHDAQAVSGLGRSTLYRLMDAGEISFVKIGKRRLIVLASLEQRLAAPAA